MKKTVLIIMALTVLSKFVGFFRDITLAYFYGASGISDAYIVAITVPSVIFGFIATGISTGYIPMYNKIETERDEQYSKRYTNNLLNVLYVFCTFIVILSLIFAEFIVKIFASGFEGEILALTTDFTRITIAGIYFSITIRILSAYLNMKKLFAVPTLIGLPLSFVFIIFIFLSDRFDWVYLLAIGNVTALAVQLIILLIFAYKKGYRYRFVFDVKDIYIKRMLFLAIPVILGTAVSQINKLIDRTLASQIEIGAISSLNYANTLILFIQGVVVVSISTVMYPAMSKMASKGNMDGLKRSVLQAMTGVNMFVLPATAGALIFARPIVELLFGRGAFTTEDVILTATAFFYYSIGMIGFGLREVLSRAFYSLQDTRTPMINATIAVALNIVLNFILAYYMGIAGLALATSISALIATALLSVALRKKLGAFGLKSAAVPFVKILLASIIMGIITKVIFDALLVLGMAAALTLSVLIGAVVYFILLYVLKIEEAQLFLNQLKQRMAKKRK
ncbi:murein biosynthesis integral membrane protein MurJ [Planococcus lenghuensis]|uniref:Probable lipid II flippase MurJ n=1 Tax=Planococcus lenghuensis TaxID=2213202 RepID=A0A1Q2KZC2_9BACL|nr:murein biosynthesis integral membrane protein MurJ [Planococcus lenghuensis]AQQ53549.1 murein biosynthesis integral membrane protein MurJ [Planococcus lenghuensis]